MQDTPESPIKIEDRQEGILIPLAIPLGSDKNTAVIERKHSPSTKLNQVFGGTWSDFIQKNLIESTSELVEDQENMIEDVDWKNEKKENRSLPTVEAPQEYLSYQQRYHLRENERLNDTLNNCREILAHERTGTNDPEIIIHYEIMIRKIEFELSGKPRFTKYCNRCRRKVYHNTVECYDEEWITEHMC